MRTRASRRGPACVETLTDAVALLESTTAWLDLAHALTDLGAVLPQSGHTEQSGTRLRQALDLAEAQGSTAATEPAHAVLLAAGARPRRRRQTDVTALTRQESRIVMLAPGRLTNDEIASELFVARRTMEFHLTQAFRKLGIYGRHDLARALPRA
ncbi:helix-turn-helix transcriptional regulator [Streptomyces alanosinicus]|uniref:HTH luxR-type domain-containing protein n=1 Tax=Streptomyces alanosinicus TaxID=68171 RepID=A0A918YM80_9ACTN|nr:LuxR C-terminal-related transcriptional regulator [Streptomyces alanosinicus]GHE09042.1 hypothetical protein GCM10010339_60050 [Streptomyces alanosinicus]